MDGNVRHLGLRSRKAHLRARLSWKWVLSQSPSCVCTYVCVCVCSHTALKSPGPWHVAPSSSIHPWYRKGYRSCKEAEITPLPFEKFLLSLGRQNVTHTQCTYLSIAQTFMVIHCQVKEHMQCYLSLFAVCKLSVHRSKTRMM